MRGSVFTLVLAFFLGIILFPMGAKARVLTPLFHL